MGDIVNIFQRAKEKQLSVIERVENCTWHVVMRDSTEALSCEYCKYRSSLSERVFQDMIQEALQDAKRYNWELTTLDVKFIFAEAIEKVMELEQEMVSEQSPGESKEYDGKTQSRESDAEKTSVSHEETTRETEDQS